MAATRKIIRGLKRLRFTIAELAADLKIPEYRTYLGDGILQIGTVAIDAVPEKFKTTTVLYWRRNGIQFTTAATTALVFASAYTINTAAAAGIKWGAFLLQISDTGTVTSKAVAANQSYASEALAIAALPAADAGNKAFAYITVAATTGADWVAITDDMTDGSDCTEANFYDLPVVAFPAAVV